MSWLKFDTATPEKPEVFAITLALGWEDPDLTVGKLLKVWRWFDLHSVDGNAKSVTLALLDRLIGVTGLSQAMVDVGWLVVSSDGLTLPNFEMHNGKTAKDRALTAKRAAGHRINTSSNGKSNAKSVTNALPREEKRREENIKDTHLNTREAVVDNFSQGCVSDFSKNPKTEKNPDENPEDSFPETPAGEICRALKLAGLPSVSPQHPELLALMGKGVTLEQFADAAKTAVEKGKNFAYMLGVVKGQLRDANTTEGAAGMPAKAWDADPQSVGEMAVRLGVKPWQQASSENAFMGEAYPVFLMRVSQAYHAANEVAA